MSDTDEDPDNISDGNDDGEGEVTAEPPERVFQPVNDGCEFSHDPCRLGSPMRKVISHIFGRNKSATAAIPDEMIPKICRKHYQRARYRVGIFGLLQWRLVQKVLTRTRLAGDITRFHVQVRKRAIIDGREGSGNGAADPRNTVYQSRVPADLATLLELHQPYTHLSLSWIMDGIQAVLEDAKERGETRYFPDIEILPLAPEDMEDAARTVILPVPTASARPVPVEQSSEVEDAMDLDPDPEASDAVSDAEDDSDYEEPPHTPGCRKRPSKGKDVKRNTKRVKGR